MLVIYLVFFFCSRAVPTVPIDRKAKTYQITQNTATETNMSTTTQKGKTTTSTAK